MTAIVTGMYVFAGFRDALIKLEKSDEARAEMVKACLGGGEIECAQTISSMAFDAQRVVNRVYDEAGPQNFPGVWEYDIGEALGEWLVAQTMAFERAPTDTEWQDRVEQCTRAWVISEGQCTTLAQLQARNY